MDPLADYLAECCIVAPGVKCKAGELYRAYKTWAEANSDRPMSLTAFGLALGERGLEAKKSTGGVVFRLGVGLKE